MVPGTTGKILGDMGVHEIGPAGLEIHEGIANIGLALAQGLHFGAMENEAGLHPFEDVIVVRSGAILSDNLVGLGFGVFAFLLALLWSLLRTLLRSVIWLSHNLSFYLMARLSERTGSTPSGNTQRPGRNPSHGEDRMTGSRAGSLIGSIFGTFIFRRTTCSRMSGFAGCRKARNAVPWSREPIEGRADRLRRSIVGGPPPFLRQGKQKAVPSKARKTTLRCALRGWLTGDWAGRATGTSTGTSTGTGYSVELKAC